MSVFFCESTCHWSRPRRAWGGTGTRNQPFRSGAGRISVQLPGSASKALLTSFDSPAKRVQTRPQIAITKNAPAKLPGTYVLGFFMDNQLPTRAHLPWCGWSRRLSNSSRDKRFLPASISQLFRQTNKKKLALLQRGFVHDSLQFRFTHGESLAEAHPRCNETRPHRPHPDSWPMNHEID